MIEISAALRSSSAFSPRRVASRKASHSPSAIAEAMRMPYQRIESWSEPTHGKSSGSFRESAMGPGERKVIGGGHAFRWVSGVGRDGGGQRRYAWAVTCATLLRPGRVRFGSLYRTRARPSNEKPI